VSSIAAPARGLGARLELPDIDVGSEAEIAGFAGHRIAGDSIYVLSSVALIRLDRNMRLLATIAIHPEALP